MSATPIYQGLFFQLDEESVSRLLSFLEGPHSLIIEDQETLDLLAFWIFYQVKSGIPQKLFVTHTVNMELIEQRFHLLEYCIRDVKFRLDRMSDDEYREVLAQVAEDEIYLMYRMSYTTPGHLTVVVAPQCKNIKLEYSARFRDLELIRVMCIDTESICNQNDMIHNKYFKTPVPEHLVAAPYTEAFAILSFDDLLASIMN